MTKLRILDIQFEPNIAPYEVPAFRGAILEKVGREDTALFHNHLDDNKFVYEYPRIQYKRIGQKPCIICIEKGVDEIHRFFEHKNWTVQLGEKLLELKIAQLKMNEFTMNVWDKSFDYHIHHWLALNQENYHKFRELEAITDQIFFLENILKGNILSFAKSLDWEIERPIDLKIISTPHQKLLKYKATKLLSFDLDFKTNVFIPNYIGLGKSVSVGFGVVSAKKKLYIANEN